MDTSIKISQVQEAQDTLEWLWKQLWRLIITGKVADARTKIAGDVFKNMEQTQKELDKLKKLLIDKLTQESYAWVFSEAKGKAEVIINILNRNLFERTADIWFLATDDDVRCFLCSSEDNLEKNSEFIIKRLQEYKAKYSVYNNIYIFQPDGSFVLSANNDKNISYSQDTFIQKAQQSWDQKFIEYFWECSFCLGEKLFYAYKITKTDEKNAPVIGVMVLEFDFENEMKMIFESIDYGTDSSVNCLLDEDWRVIATNTLWLKGKKLETSLNQATIRKIWGKDYVCYSSEAQWYQGFHWQKWYGHSLIPVEYAFNNKNEWNISHLDIHEVLKSKLVGEDLREVINLVDKLNQDIKYMIINGHLIVSREQSDYSKGMKPIFDEVVNISDGCREVFSQSIGNMFNVVIKNLLSDIKSIASLGINIMDRNLYERANDARWWALTSKFKIILERSEHPERELDMMENILWYIHELYTVYHTLFLYDTNGNILSASQLDAKGKHILPKQIVGKNIKRDDFIPKTLSYKPDNSQLYCVSSFSASDIYDSKATYTYSAPISNIQNNKVVGGIGIVFDSEPQFKQMLLDILPKHNGEVQEGTFWIFVERSGKIIASTSNNYPIGTLFQIDPIFLSLRNGESHSNIIEINNEKYIVWSACSSGYREYKVSDGYKNDIVCMVFVKL